MKASPRWRRMNGVKENDRKAEGEIEKWKITVIVTIIGELDVRSVGREWMRDCLPTVSEYTCWLVPFHHPIDQTINEQGCHVHQAPSLSLLLSPCLRTLNCLGSHSIIMRQTSTQKYASCLVHWNVLPSHFSLELSAIIGMAKVGHNWRTGAGGLFGVWVWLTTQNAPK